MIKKINHIGIAVKSIAEAAKFYETLGLRVEALEEVPSQQVKVGFITVGETRIELLEPTSEDSPIAKFIEKKGEGIQHIAVSVDSTQEAIENCEAQGIAMIDKAPRPGAHNTSIAFVHPKSSRGVLLEFCQENHK